jgi:aspartate aminotransferase
MMLKIKLSNRARNTPPSPIRKLAPYARKARLSGAKVFQLNIGQPDIESPAEFFEGLRRFDQRVVAYDPSQGNETLCAAWSKYVNRSLGLQTAPEQFLITMGASEALVFLFMTCCDPGDEVIIFDPTYANYLGFAAISGVNLVPVVSDMDNNFCLPPLNEIEQKLTNRTRAILLCNPNNPTGTVYSEQELRFLLNLCDEHNIFLIVDEAYREFVYDGLKPLSVLHLSSNNDRVIVVDSLSKRFSLCGARIGCLLTTNEEVLATTLNIAQARLAAPTIEQFAAAYMLENIHGDYLERVRSEYEMRRDALYEALGQTSGIIAHKPKGAFYSVVRLPVEDAEEFATFLLSSFLDHGRTTFVAPAAGFYMQNERGKDKARIAYVLEAPQMKEAVEVLGAGLEAFRRR